MTPLEEQRLALQADCDAAKTQRERNRLGQFATPTTLALDVVAQARQLVPTGEAVRFLDPAIGTGSFFSALLAAVAPADLARAVGFEIDPHYGEPSRRLWEQTPLELYLADFTKVLAPEPEGRFNLIVCNPPYVRHHHLTREEKVRLQDASAVACGVRIGGLAGLYCYFLALSHPWMSENGVAAWLIPTEFMDVNYGRQVKHYLLERVTLLRIHRFDPHDVQFDDALVSSAVVLFRKASPSRDHVVQFTYGGSLTAPVTKHLIPASTLKRETKWTRLFSSPVRQASSGIKLSDLFKIQRGLATGANEFFILTRGELVRRHLPPELFRPILPSPRHIATDEIMADAHGNPLVEPQLFLLDCALPEEQVRAEYPSLWDYLQTGVPAIASRYLCQYRTPWYSQEKRPCSPFLCTYLARNSGASGRPFRFILNHSAATVANVYLLLYPQGALASALAEEPLLARQVWETLREIPVQTLFGEGRVYGGGLYKLEPKELANVPGEPLAALLPEHLRPTVAARQLSFAEF